MKLKIPRPKLEATGQIILRYEGDNTSILNKRVASEARLTFNQDEVKLSFKEYGGTGLELDLLKSECLLITDEKESIKIGTLVNFEVAVNNSHIFISGTYDNEPIQMYYYEHNPSSFEFVAPVESPGIDLLVMINDALGYDIDITDWR
ncbi:hypothetical protein [Jiulongibacter sediminis]|uniref:hypothetical protein n=1 Tax=Jiulongibacter sediminis TaxID=1605367 RepID=UPI0026EE6AB9|nr:hypothetical protein [Jiulongibacter sediminis]